jgi:hypothetical protein
MRTKEGMVDRMPTGRCNWRNRIADFAYEALKREIHNQEISLIAYTLNIQKRDRSAINIFTKKMLLLKDLYEYSHCQKNAKETFVLNILRGS